MTRRYDLVIVGTGTAATVAAMRLRTAGWSVAIVDFRPFGGTCALRGCDPKKMLIAGAETVRFRRLVDQALIPLTVKKRAARQ
jgi:glutathione reductase (NADPH)